MVPRLAVLLVVMNVLWAYGGQLQLSVPGSTDNTMTETEVRNGGKAVLLKVKGDTWVSTNFNLYRPSIRAGISSAGEEVAGFMAKIDRILPMSSIVLDLRFNDFTVIALLLQIDPTFNIVKDETVFISIPGNVTVSGQVPLPISGSQVSFIIKAGQSVLKIPPLIEESMVRSGGLSITLYLTNGEQFKQRQDGAIDDLINGFNSSLMADPSEPNNFVAMRHLALTPNRFEILAPDFDHLIITMNAVPSYNFYAPQEIVNITVPVSLMVSGFIPTPRTPLGMVIANSEGTCHFSTTVDITESMVRSGTASFVLVLKHDKWAFTGLSNESTAVIGMKKNLISRFKATTPNSRWQQRTEAGAILAPSSFELLDSTPDAQSEQRLKVQFLADPAYEIASDAGMETVTFTIPSSAVVSGLVPRGGAGKGIYQFDVKAMGSVTFLSPPAFIPEHSGDIRGTAGAKSSMLLIVKLTKDKWMPAQCRDILRTAFASSLDRTKAPYAFLSKLDLIVNPNSVHFTQCGNKQSCEMRLVLSQEPSYSLRPADGWYSPEVITLSVPPQCVSLGIRPAGTVEFTIDVHPLEVTFETYIPPVIEGTLPKPEVFGSVYSNREFHIEAHYSNPAVWVEYRLMKNIECKLDGLSPSYRAVEWGNCSTYTCSTGAAKYPSAMKIVFRPTDLKANEVWTDPGTWSICVMYAFTSRWTRLGEPISIERDPLFQEPPVEVDLAANVDLRVVVIGSLVLLCLVGGLAFIIREIVLSAREGSGRPQQPVLADIFATQMRRSSGEEAGHRETGLTPLEGMEDRTIDFEGELPEVSRVAKYAYTVFGGSDPRVQHLKRNGDMAYVEHLAGQKERLGDMGLLDTDSEEEVEEVEEAEEGEEEEACEDEESDERTAIQVHWGTEPSDGVQGAPQGAAREGAAKKTVKFS